MILIKKINGLETATLPINIAITLTSFPLLPKHTLIKINESFSQKMLEKWKGHAIIVTFK